MLFDMKVKFLFLLPVIALALAAGLTNCAKDTPLPTAAHSDNAAALRGACDITVVSFGNVQICGTQTNNAACSPNATGLENVGAGAVTYAIAPPAVMEFTNVNNSNPGQDGVWIEVSSPGNAPETRFILNGASEVLSIDDNCKVQ